MTGKVETVDAIVIGANIRGLVTAYVLGSLGYRAALIERSAHVGGADGSFVTDQGTRFDHGLHVLDAMRSALATRLFSHVTDGKVHEITLRRGIVLRNHMIPYAPELSALPEEIRRMLPGHELVDHLGDAAPTRARLAEYYGSEFTDMIFEEVLHSYPSEARHLKFDVDESELMANIYPWFFPQADRQGKTGDESRAFHDKLRAGIEQRVLYPQDGGFGGFAQGFIRHMESQDVELLFGAKDVALEIEPGTHRVSCVRTGGRTLKAANYFWAGSWSGLCGLLDVPCQNAATDKVFLGSFRLNRPALTDFHELLVGDPDHHINRLYFPAAFRNADDPLMQIEFAAPLAETWPEDGDEWRQRWEASVRRLGLLTEDHRVEEFDFRSFPLHFNSFGAEGEPLRDADPDLLQPDSNVRPVVPSMANLNLNRYVPRAVRYVTDVLAATTPRP